MQITILEKQNFDSQQQLFASVSELLIKQKKVKSSFYNALIKREKEFPTGLEGKVRNIAIPHVDAEHVLESGYVIIKNNNFLNFKNMSDKNENLKVDLIIFILSNDSKAHMELLRKTLKLTSTLKVNTKTEFLNYFGIKKEII